MDDNFRDIMVRSRMFTMTFNEALLIQRAQMVYYRNAIGRKGVKSIRKRTIFPIDINPNEEMSVIKINKLVPRGGDFEYLINGRGKSCPNNLDWCNAIKRGLF